MGSLSFKSLDTTPGKALWCAPSKPVEDYHLWLIDSLSRSQGSMQYFGFLARLVKESGWNPSYPEKKPDITGPYSSELLEAVTTKLDFISKEALTRRTIRVKADAELNKQKSEEEKAAKKTAKATSKARKPIKNERQPIDEWKASNSAKDKNKSFMDAFRSSAPG